MSILPTLKTNHECFVCLTEMPPLEDTPTQRAATPILHRTDNNWYHRICSTDCAKGLFSLREPICPVAGCLTSEGRPTPLTPEMRDMDERVQALFTQTIAPDEIFNGDVPADEQFRRWLLHDLAHSHENTPQREIEWLNEYPLRWHLSEQITHLAMRRAISCHKVPFFLRAMESLIQRSNLCPSFLLLDCIQLSALLQDPDQLRQFYHLAINRQVRLSFEEFVHIFLFAIRVRDNLAESIFFQISPYLQPEFITLSMYIISRKLQNDSEQSLYAAQKILELFESTGEFRNIDDLGEHPWHHPPLARILLDAAERNHLPIPTRKLSHALDAAIQSQDLELQNRLLSFNEAQTAQILSQAYSKFLYLESQRDVIKVIDLMHERGLLQAYADSLLLKTATSSKLNAFLTTCKEYAISSLRPESLNFAFSFAIASGNEQSCRQILSYDASLSQSLLFSAARHLCNNWSLHKTMSQPVLIRQLQILLDLSYSSQCLEELKEEIQKSVEGDLLEEISNMPEWWRQCPSPPKVNSCSIL